MKAKKIVAGVIIGAAAPVLLDCAVDPRADRGLARSWLYGATAIAGMAVLAWAADQLGMVPEQAEESAKIAVFDSP